MRLVLTIVILGYLLVPTPPVLTIPIPASQLSQLHELISLREIQQTYLTLNANPPPQVLVENSGNKRNQLNFAPTQFVFNYQ